MTDPSQPQFLVNDAQLLSKDRNQSTESSPSDSLKLKPSQGKQAKDPQTPHPKKRDPDTAPDPHSSLHNTMNRIVGDSNDTLDALLEREPDILDVLIKEVKVTGNLVCQ